MIPTAITVVALLLVIGILLVWQNGKIEALRDKVQELDEVLRALDPRE